MKAASYWWDSPVVMNRLCRLHQGIAVRGSSSSRMNGPLSARTGLKSQGMWKRNDSDFIIWDGRMNCRRPSLHCSLAWMIYHKCSTAAISDPWPDYQANICLTVLNDSVSVHGWQCAGLTVFQHWGYRKFESILTFSEFQFRTNHRFQLKIWAIGSIFIPLKPTWRFFHSLLGN